jgi:dolichyl-phosphate-mannose-protein mannosyltransferase
VADKIRARRGPRRSTIAVGVFALAVHVVYWHAGGRHYVPVSDAAQYRELAVNVAHGRGLVTQFMRLPLHPTAFRPPLWPLLLGLVWRLTGPSLGAGQLLNVLLGVATAMLAEHYVRSIGGRVAGLCAGALIALYPPLLVNDVTILSDTLALLLMLAVLIEVDAGRWIRAGLWTGLLVLTKPSAQALVVVVGLWLIGTAGWRAAARTMLTALIVMAPWLARNWLELGSPVVVTSNGFNLAAMYSPPARASGHFVDPVFDPRFSEMQALEADEVRWDHALTSEAVRFIESHPSQVLAVVRHNVAAMSEVSKKLGSQADRLDHRNPKLQRHTRVLFWSVSALGLAGLLWHRRDRRVQLAALVSVALTVASVLVVAPPRLRGPFDALCCLGAGLLAGRMVGALRRRTPLRTLARFERPPIEAGEAQPAA